MDKSIYSFDDDGPYAVYQAEADQKRAAMQDWGAYLSGSDAL